MIGPLFQKYEGFLRFDELKTTADIMRARGVYVIGWIFVLSQLINIVFMSMSYGGWTSDHAISVIASLLVIIAIHGLRYSKNLMIYALFYSVLLLLGVLASAVTEHTGINSALLPLIVAGALLNGYVGNWRSVLGYMIGALILIWGLYYLCLLYTSDAADE